MNATVFVDTNVFVYARDASEPEKQAAAEAWLRELWIEQRGRTSMQVLSEYYTVVTHKLKPGLAPEDAWEDVTALLAWEPQPIDGNILARAHAIEQRYKLNWWDAMIVAAAQLQDCSVLLTEDLQHGLRCDGLTIQSPFAATVAEEPPAYAAVPQRSTRHRARGRPSRTARPQPA
jgi:predicted nucleic acid-binding protein